MYLILGSTGYVGSHFFDYLSSLGENVLGLSRENFDYTDEWKVASFLKEKQPKFLINTAG